MNGIATLYKAFPCPISIMVRCLASMAAELKNKSIYIQQNPTCNQIITDFFMILTF